MQGVNKVMGSVNDQMNMTDIQKMIREFAKESEKFGMKQDIFQDALEMTGDANADEEAENVYNQICEEQGLAQMTENNAAVGTGAIGAKQQAEQNANAAEMDDLESRLNALNK